MVLASFAKSARLTFTSVSAVLLLLLGCIFIFLALQEIEQLKDDVDTKCTAGALVDVVKNRIRWGEGFMIISVVSCASLLLLMAFLNCIRSRHTGAPMIDKDDGPYILKLVRFVLLSMALWGSVSAFVIFQMVPIGTLVSYNCNGASVFGQVDEVVFWAWNTLAALTATFFTGALWALQSVELYTLNKKM